MHACMYVCMYVCISVCLSVCLFSLSGRVSRGISMLCEAASTIAGRYNDSTNITKALINYTG